VFSPPPTHICFALMDSFNLEVKTCSALVGVGLLMKLWVDVPLNISSGQCIFK
jgi:hypothetical protein